VALDSGAVRQVTNFRTGKDPEAKPTQTDLQAYLETQQRELFDYIQETERTEEDRKEREKAARGPRPEPFYLKDSQRVSDLQLSPDGTFVTFILAERAEAEKGKVVDMPTYVTKSGFVETQKLTRGFDIGRVKAGEPVVMYTLGVVTLADGSVAWVDHGQRDRQVSFNAPVWSEDGRRAVAWAGSVDHKDAWLLLLDLPATSSRVVVNEHDDAWVRGFRAGRLAQGDAIAYGWMPDGNVLHVDRSASGRAPGLLDAARRRCADPPDDEDRMARLLPVTRRSADRAAVQRADGAGGAVRDAERAWRGGGAAYDVEEGRVPAVCLAGQRDRDVRRR
jgi:hypothetical protein